MNKVALRILKATDSEKDIDIVSRYMPEIGDICSSNTRAGIIHMLIKTPETMHSMKVEDICYRLGISQSVCIHHLEKLLDWDLLEIKKKQKYGKKEKRTIWGLNLNYPQWITECYKNIRVHFYTQKELEKIVNINKSFRKK